VDTISFTGTLLLIAAVIAALYAFNYAQTKGWVGTRTL
jgi:hypothetical protein